MDSKFETKIHACASGRVRLKSGRYRVTLLHDSRGNLEGAELLRIDVEGPPWPIRLTAIQWGLLDGTISSSGPAELIDRGARLGRTMRLAYHAARDMRCLGATSIASG
jgi:hypothetical protein